MSPHARHDVGLVLGCITLFLFTAGLEGAPRVDAECEYGISLALQGDLRGAEKAFISMLSHSPADARALNNLGNIALYRGQVEASLEFYGQAGEADSTDAGILMNRATALLLAGERDAALQTAELGVGRAGSARVAAGLLGLMFDDSPEDRPKGSEKVHLSEEEVLFLLRIAAGKVPADTLASRDAPAAPDSGESQHRKPIWRSAGPRAGLPDQVLAVYWKY